MLAKKQTLIKPWKTSVKLWNTRKEDIMYNGYGKKIAQSSKTIINWHMELLSRLK